MKPLGFHDYNHLQLHVQAVLSDSGTINEEIGILNFPALNLREAHEREGGLSAMMVGLEVDRVRQGLAILATSPAAMTAATPTAFARWLTTACPMCLTRCCASSTATPTT